MKLKLSDTFDSITEADLNEFENRNALQLPKVYREFLLQHNGGRPNLNVFTTLDEEEGSDIQFFYGLNQGGVYDLDYGISLSERFPKDFLAIASDSGGNFILLKLSTEEVFFFDHEIEEVNIIAKSFNDFLARLYRIEKEVSNFDQAVEEEDIAYFESKLKEFGHVDDIVSEYNHTLIFKSANRNKLNLVKFCIENGANYEGILPTVCESGYMNLAKYLLSIGVNPDERTSLNGDTAFMLACFSGNMELVKLLIANGADINVVNDHDQTPFRKAIWSNNEDLVEYLKKEVYKRDDLE